MSFKCLARVVIVFQSSVQRTWTGHAYYVFLSTKAWYSVQPGHKSRNPVAVARTSLAGMANIAVTNPGRHPADGLGCIVVLEVTPYLAA